MHRTHRLVSLTALALVVTAVVDAPADYIVQDRFFLRAGRYSDSGELLSTFRSEEETESAPYKLLDNQIYFSGNSLGYISTYRTDLADWCPASGSDTCPEPPPATWVWGTSPSHPPFQATPAGGGPAQYFHLSFPGSIVDLPGGDKYTFARVTPTTAGEPQERPSFTDPALPIRLSFENPTQITPMGVGVPNQPPLPENIASTIGAPDGSILFSAANRVDNVTFEYSVQRLVISEPNPAEPYGSYSLETLFLTDYLVQDLEFDTNGMLYAIGGTGPQGQVLVYDYSNDRSVDEFINLSTYASSTDRSFVGAFFDDQGNLLVSETGPINLDTLSSPTTQSRLLEFDGTTGEFRRVALTTQGRYAAFTDGFYVPIPEPGAAGLIAAMGSIACWRSRRANRSPH